jgi:alkylation response protein AidB-like acyl-CoA dehydrogenase
MDLTLNETQQQIIDAVDRIVDRAGGHRHSQDIVAADAFDQPLFDELSEAGFFGLATDGLTLLEATLVTERLSFLGAYVGAGGTAIAYPAVMGEAASGPVALASDRTGAPFRMGAQAAAILIDGGAEARLLVPEEGDVVSLFNDHAGWALASLTEKGMARARLLGADSGDRLRQGWRLAIAAEAVGAMRGALKTTARYLTERVQFGRPLATFQALQHRLATMTVQTEGSYWLTLEAAAFPDDPFRAAVATTHAMTAAPILFRECHQMHGAMGFTREYRLHVWTMQLPALQRELGGMSHHARAVTKLRTALT